MNKYQKQINPANQVKYPHKKPAQQKKNPAAHQAWLDYKKARNQAQYEQRKKCLTCQQPGQKAYFVNSQPRGFFCGQFSCFQQWVQTQNLKAGEDY